MLSLFPLAHGRVSTYNCYLLKADYLLAETAQISEVCIEHPSANPRPHGAQKDSSCGGAARRAVRPRRRNAVRLARRQLHCRAALLRVNLATCTPNIAEDWQPAGVCLPERRTDAACCRKRCSLRTDVESRMHRLLLAVAGIQRVVIYRAEGPIWEAADQLAPAFGQTVCSPAERVMAAAWAAFGGRILGRHAVDLNTPSRIASDQLHRGWTGGIGGEEPSRNPPCDGKLLNAC